MTNPNMNDNNDKKWNNDDDDTRIMRPVSRDNSNYEDSTEVIQPQNSYSEPTENEYSESEGDTIHGISRKIERLERAHNGNPSELFGIANGLVNAVASLSSEYNSASSEISRLQSISESKDATILETQKELEASKAKNAPYNKAAMEEREEEFSEKEKKNKNLRNILIGVAVALGVVLVVVTSLYIGEKDKGASSDERSATQQEQVRSLKSSLDEAKKGEASAQSKVSDLEGQVNSLNGDKDSLQQERDDARNELNARNQEVEELQNQLQDIEPETVTVTDAPPAETVTESPRTSTTTVTVAPNND